MRIAVLADVHGYLPPLRAVLAELDELEPDAIVVAGDVVAGPFVAECLELLDARPERVQWVRGNGEREAVAAFDGTPMADDPAGRAAVWSARRLTLEWRHALASWPIALTLDGVVFCHGSPRRDDEILTRLTPEAALREALRGVTEPLVVGGHTHQQFVRTIEGGPTIANAGSVGLPYEGRAAAFWMLIDERVPIPRETVYDTSAAIAELETSGYPDLADDLDGTLVELTDPGWVAAYFEHQAGRGPDPGELVRVA